MYWLLFQSFKLFIFDKYILHTSIFNGTPNFWSIVTYFTGYNYETEPGYLSRYSYSLRAGRSGDRIPVGARFPAPVQTSPEAQPASYTTGTGSLPRVKRLGRGIDRPPQSSVEVKERVQPYLYSPSGPSWPVLGWTLPFTFIFSPTCFGRYCSHLQGDIITRIQGYKFV